MARWSLVIFILFFSLSPLSAQTFMRGDANGDGQIDISDPIKILFQLFLEPEPPTCADSSDANDDGELDLSDVLTLLGYLFLDGRQLPPPFPGPGVDLTPDPLCCGPRCNPDLSGIWSGTFFDETEGEYVVFFEVEDTGEGTMILSGLESIGNEIFGGEVFFWSGTDDRRLAFDYVTAFDAVEADFTLSPDGNIMENGEYFTTSGTAGTFSMVRLSGLPSLPGLEAGEYKIVFTDLEETMAWGGRLLLDGNGTVASGDIALTPLVPRESKFERSMDPLDLEAGVYTGFLKDESGYAASLLGLLGADTGYLSGTFTDGIGMEGFFLIVPVEEP